MRKTVILTMILTLIFATAGCTDHSEPDEKTAESSSSNAVIYTTLSEKLPEKTENETVEKSGKDQSMIDEIVDEIMTIREKRQFILTEAAMRKDVQDRIEGLSSFLDEQVKAVTEYSETLVRRLIEKITVCDEKMIVEFKSGLEAEVNV